MKKPIENMSQSRIPAVEKKLINKKVKYIAINATKQMQDSDTEKHKTLLRNEIRAE